MDRNAQMINQTSHRANRPGFVDLTLRLGYPNHDQCDGNQIQIGQNSLDPTALNTQQAVFRYLNGSHSHSDQAMQNYGKGIPALSGDNNISNNTVNNAGYCGPNNSNYLGLGFTHNGILGQQNQTNSEATALDQVLLSSAPNPNPPLANPSMPSIEDYRRALQNPNSRVTATTNTGRRGQSSRRSNKKSAKNPNNNNNNGDANKRCSNRECGVSSTPMWRKGPLGPKSLCNACGIKYRKQVEKMAAIAVSNHEASSTD